MVTNQILSIVQFLFYCCLKHNWSSWWIERVLWTNLFLLHLTNNLLNMNAYSNKLLFFINCLVITRTFFLWKQAKQNEIHAVLGHLLPWTLCQPWNFPFEVRHFINFLVLSFFLPVVCLHLAASLHSLLPVSQPHLLRLILASLSLVFLCLSYTVATQRTGADCTDLNFQQIVALAQRQTSLF